MKPQQAQLIHDLNKSAGSLCYELCQQYGIQSPELDRLVHFNNVSDLFLENSPDFILATDYANLVKTYEEMQSQMRGGGRQGPPPQQ